MEPRVRVCNSGVCKKKERPVNVFGRCMACSKVIMDPLPEAAPKCPQCGSKLIAGMRECVCGKKVLGVVDPHEGTSRTKMCSSVLRRILSMTIDLSRLYKRLKSGNARKRKHSEREGKKKRRMRRNKHQLECQTTSTTTCLTAKAFFFVKLRRTFNFVLDPSGLGVIFISVSTFLFQRSQKCSPPKAKVYWRKCR